MNQELPYIKVAVKGRIGVDIFIHASDTGFKTIANGFASFFSRNKDSMPVDNIKDNVDAEDRISDCLQDFSIAVLGSWTSVGI